jgi:prepilin-type N-terminal cleavage/methylation domain-containing protein
MAMKTQKSGFTLTEMLLVLAVLALAAMLLLPAMGLAREQSKQNVCQAQLCQIGKAVLIYTADNAGKLPTQGLYTSGPNIGRPVVSYLNSQSCCNYYSYWSYPDWISGAGPAEFGHLYISGLLVNDSDIAYCPSFRGYSMASYSGQPSSWGTEFNSWNSKGNPTHWNYIGVNANNAPPNPQPEHLLPEDEAQIGWLNLRLSYGFRPMYNMGISNLNQTNNGMSYISDVWMATPSLNAAYRIHIDEVSHVNRGSTEADMHAWYFDGHIERRTFPRNKYFVSSHGYSTLPANEGGFINHYPTITWSVLFENAPYDFSPAR